MVFKLRTALHDLNQSYLDGNIPNSDSTSQSNEQSINKVRRAMNQLENLLFNPDFLQEEGILSLRKREIQVIDDFHPTIEIHRCASILHIYVFHALQDKEQLTDVQYDVIQRSLRDASESSHLRGNQHKKVRKQLCVLADNTPLLVKLSEMFFSSTPQLVRELEFEVDLPESDHETEESTDNDQEPEEGMMDGVRQDLREIAAEASFAVNVVRNRVARFFTGLSELPLHPPEEW